MVSNKTHTQPANKTENLYNSTKPQQSYTPTYHQARIGSINVRTAKDEMRLAQHMIQIKNLKQDITCMQEARIINQGEIIFDDPILDGWKVVHNGMKTAVAGVAIVLAPHVQLIDIIHILDGRISCVRVKVRGTKLAVFSCYAPTEQHAPSTKESFHNCLSKAIIAMKKEHSSYKLVICGDFNATIGNDCDPDSWNSIGKFNDDAPTSFNGTKLIETAHNHNLYLLNTMYATRTDKHRWSFQSNLGYERRLDYIMVEWYIKRFAQNCRCYPQASLPFDSDHRILVLDLQLPSKKTVKKIFKGKSTQEKTANYDVRPLRDSELVRLGYTQLIDHLLDTPSTSTQIDELEKIIVDALTEASKKVLLKLEREKDVKPWKDVKFLQMVEERHREKDDKNNKALGKRIKNLRISLKNKYFKQKANAINEASEMRDTEEEFRLAKGYTSLSRSGRPMIQPNVLEKHFISHFSNRETIIQPEISHPQEFPHILPPKDLQGVDETCPTEAEVKQTLSGFNNGKCQGTDNLKAEQLKYSESKNLLKYLVFFLHIIWTNMVIPSVWLLSSITCLHKNGLKSLASNYRGISIISTLSKPLCLLVKNAIN